jgi:hypothetical protein
MGACHGLGSCGEVISVGSEKQKGISRGKGKGKWKGGKPTHKPPVRENLRSHNGASVRRTSQSRVRREDRRRRRDAEGESDYSARIECLWATVERLSWARARKSWGGVGDWMANAAWQNKVSQINLDKFENELGRTLPEAHSRSGLAVLTGGRTLDGSLSWFLWRSDLRGI